MKLHIRASRPEDDDALHHIYFRAVREGTAQFYTQEQRIAWAPSEKRQKPFDPALICWVAEDEAQPVGFMAVEPGGYLDLAFVLPEYMGRGVGKALYEELLGWANTIGLKHLTTHASHLAQRFFLRHGWKVDYPETLERNGQKLERFAMSLSLKNPQNENP